VFLLSSSVWASQDAAADPKYAQITIEVGDTTADSGELNSVISVFLTNVVDSVAAFELWLQLSRPDIAIFQTEMDTVVDTTHWICEEWSGPDCIDSVSCNPDSTTCEITHIDTVEAYMGNFDTSGCLTSGWELMMSRSITQAGFDIKVTGIADKFGTPGVTLPIGPQTGGVLFRLLADVQEVHDTIINRTANIFVPQFLDHFNISRTDGTSIGIIGEEVLDSNFWRCNAWVPPLNEVCLDWEKVPGPEYDSVFVEIDTVAILDTSAVHLEPGELTINLYTGACCDSLGVCYITSHGQCIAYGGTFFGLDVPCTGIQCTGACCVDEICSFVSEYECGNAGGIYKGGGVTCTPDNPCLTCCIPPSVGDLDQSGGELGFNYDGADLSLMINGLFISPAHGFDDICLDEADIDFSCGRPCDNSMAVDGADLSILINAMFINPTSTLDPCM